MVQSSLHSATQLPENPLAAEFIILPPNTHIYFKKTGNLEYRFSYLKTQLNFLFVRSPGHTHIEVVCWLQSICTTSSE